VVDPSGAVGKAARIPTPSTPLGFMLAIASVAVTGAVVATYKLASDDGDRGLLYAVWAFVGLVILVEMVEFFRLVHQDPSKLMLEAKDAIAYRQLSQGDSTSGDKLETVRIQFGGASIVDESSTDESDGASS
jgi:hypothetical protein